MNIEGMQEVLAEAKRFTKVLEEGIAEAKRFTKVLEEGIAVEKAYIKKDPNCWSGGRPVEGGGRYSAAIKRARLELIKASVKVR
jgi:hypothetical protein